MKNILNRNPKNLFKIGFLTMHEDKISLNENRIRWEVLSELHFAALLNSHIRQQYLEQYEINNITTALISDRYEVDFSKANRIKKKIEKEIKRLILEQILTKPNKIISLFIRYNLIDSQLLKNKRIKSLHTNLSDEEVNTYEGIFDNCLGLPETTNTIQEFLFFYKIGLSIETSVYLVKANKFFKISRAIEFLSVLPHINLSNHELKKTYKDDEYIRKIQFAQQVDMFVKQNPKLDDFTELSELISNLKKPTDWVQHFSASTRERLDLVYKIKETTSKEKRRQKKRRQYIIQGVNSAKQLLNETKINYSDSDCKRLDEYLRVGESKIQSNLK